MTQRPGDDRDQDHRAEDPVIAYIEDPTPNKAQAAEQAVATLQRAYDHVLRRLDGDGEVPEFPVHNHNPTEQPWDCATAVLYELAGAQLADRAETLAHGLEALNAMDLQLESARATAAQAHHWHRQYHELYRRYAQGTALLKRKLSIARSWAWSERHRSWLYWWFPRSWWPTDPSGEWRLPAWLADISEPHQQNWWVTPGRVIETSLERFTGVDSGAIRQPTDPPLDVGDQVYPTDGSVYLGAEVTSLEGEWALVSVLWRSDSD